METKMFNKNFVVCWLVHFICIFFFQCSTPLIAAYALETGATLSFAGVVAGLFPVAALVFRPVSGMLADKVNAKALLLVSVAATTVGNLGYAVAAGVGVMMVGRVFHAFGFCVLTTSIVAVTMQYIPEGREAEGVGYVGVGALVANALGPGLGIMIADAFGYQIAFIITTLGCLVNIVPTFLVPKQEQARAAEKSESLRGVKRFICVDALPLAVLAFSFATCSGLGINFLKLLAEERGIPFISVFFFATAILMMIARPIAGRETDRHGLSKIVPMGIIFEAVCMVLLAFAQNFIFILGAIICRTLGQGIAQGSVQGQIMKDAAPSEKGRASATFYMGLDIGQGFITITGGVVADAFGFTAAFLLGPIMLIIGALGYIRYARR